jgi:D-alanyl-lipoteichoic acid acyltransferase DltB (MBOAT superfamily)
VETFSTFTWFLNLLAVFIVLLPVYYAVRSRRAQEWLLIVAGALLFFVVAPRLLLFYGVYWTLVFGLHVWVASTAGKQSGVWVFRGSLLAVLLPMLAWKLLPVHFHDAANLYTHVAIWQAVPLLGQVDAAKPILGMIGLSYATFRGLDLLIKSYLRLVPRQGVREFWTYALFPPIQMVGPLSEYREVIPEDKAPRRYEAENVAAGGWRILTGTVKVYLLAYPLSPSVRIFTYFDGNPTWVLWWELFCFIWYFYFNFAGFTDFALGTARLLGYRLQGNFDWPYFQTSIQGFWNHWHMSLTRFAQRNVYVPAGGYRKRTQYRAIVATMIVIALWHDVSVSFVVFGLYHAGALCAHRWWSQRKDVPRMPHAVSVVVTFIFVGLSFPLLVLPSRQILMYYGHLFGFL